MTNSKQTIPKVLILALISAAICIPSSYVNAKEKPMYKKGFAPAGFKMETIHERICGSKQPVFPNAQPNSLEEKRANEKLIMIYRQLWNLFLVRNDSKITDPKERAEIDQLMNSSRPPCINADQPVDYVRSEILNNSTQLIIQLSREVGTATDEFTRTQAKSNAAYITKELKPRLEKHETYVPLSKEQFKSKFNLNERVKEEPTPASQETFLEITKSPETSTAN